MQYEQDRKQRFRENVTPDDEIAIIQAQITAAKTGNPRAAEFVFSGLYGPVKQEHVHSGPDGDAITIRVEYVKRDIPDAS